MHNDPDYLYHSNLFQNITFPLTIISINNIYFGTEHIWPCLVAASGQDRNNSSTTANLTMNQKFRSSPLCLIWRHLLSSTHLDRANRFQFYKARGTPANTSRCCFISSAFATRISCTLTSCTHNSAIALVLHPAARNHLAPLW